MRGCSLQPCAANASNCSACKLADGYLLDPYTAIPSCVLSAGIPAGYGANSSDNTRVYPCSEAYCIACSANASNCSACDFALNGYLLDPYLVPPTCVSRHRTSHLDTVSTQLIIRKFILAATRTVSHAMPLLELLCLQHREWLPLFAPFHRPTRLCHASDSSIQVRSERHRLLQSVPVPRNQVSRLQGQRIELLCLRSRRIGHPQLVRCTSDLRSSISSSSRLRVNSADLSRFYPCTDSNCISCATNISNCSACNLANGSPAQLLRQRACLYRSRCSPIRLRPQLD